MPLFQIGYRRYEGERTSHLVRWVPITRSGVATALRSKLLRRLVFVSFLPFLYFGWVFFIIGRLTDPETDPNAPGFLIAREVVGRRALSQLHSDPGDVRAAVWSMVFASFGMIAQMLMVGLVAAIAGPPLIANDHRSRSFLVYFARPVSRLDYVLGKAGVLVVLLAMVTLLPSFLLYVMSILFSPSFAAFTQTAPVAMRMCLASLGVIVPTALVVLALSAATRQARFATASWFVLCLFGPIAHQVLQATRELSGNGWTFLLSFPHTVRTFQLGLYDVPGETENLDLGGDLGRLVYGLTAEESTVRAAVWLTLVSVGCFLYLLRRADAPTRI